MNEQNEFIKNYLHTEYVGCLKTDHEKCIDLQYEEIGNFVQNAGMFGNLEISIKHNGLVLFDTNGIYINKVFPNTEYSRDYLMGPLQADAGGRRGQDRQGRGHEEDL